MEKFSTIDPAQRKIPEIAVVEKVLSEDDRLPGEEHDKAVHAFFTSDGIASGISKDLAFVDKIPQLINEIIENKSWECLYIARGVVTPYYCRYVKGTDSENFRAFIIAKRPNGLETTIETVDRLLETEPEIKRKFRAIIYESRQGERTDMIDSTSDSDYPKSEDDLKSAQQKRIRSANRAAEAIPEVGELLDRELIAIDVAAKLGRQIKNPDNLTAEEREYVDKRDLIGIRLRQYIYTNPIPEDEDKEPAYSRELNRHVKDLLGIKDRSKSVRMDHPKKAAEKLLKFYQGKELKKLVELLQQGLDSSSEVPEELPEEDVTPAKTNNGYQESTQNNSTFPVAVTTPPKPQTDEDAEQSLDNHENSTLIQEHLPNHPLNAYELAERLGLKESTIMNVMYNEPEKFPQWTKERDPEGIAWKRSGDKNGKLTPFSPVPDDNQEDESDAIENGV